MLQIKKVWVADNGDVFLEREVDYRNPSPKEIEVLKNQALEMLDRGEFENCHYVNDGRIKYGGYYNCDNEFLGNEQIHVLTKYNTFQEKMYLNYKGELKPLWDTLK